MNIVFLGSGAFGLPTLRSLAQAHDIRAVVTQPDRHAGRKRRLTPTPIGEWAAEHLTDTPTLKPENVNEPETMGRVRGFDADAWVVIAYGQKLSKPLLAEKFAINLHASLLPRWRGAAPINHAIIAGDTQTGNSVITLAEKMDAGLILGQSQRAIDPAQTKGELHDLLAEDGPALVLRVLEQHQSGLLRPITQDGSLVTIAGKLSKADGEIDWSASAQTIANKINGLSPWPSVSVQFRTNPLKIIRAIAQEDLTADSPPGTIQNPEEGQIATGSGVLRMIEVQPPSKKPMSWSAFFNGHQIQGGESFLES